MVDDYGDLEYDPAWQDAPVDKYMQYKKTRDGITDQRHRQIEITVRDAPDSVDYESWDEFVNWQNGMNLKDAWDYLEQLRAAGLAESTVEFKMRMVQSFLQELRKRDVVNSNPVAYILDEETFTSETKEKVEATVDEVEDYLAGIPDPQYRAIGIVFAKTGIRVGEMVNIDLMDLNLDHEGYQSFIAKRGINIRPEIEDRPDSLYVPSEPTMGREYRGEIREYGNKRKRDTIIPIDIEKKHAIIDWLAMRPRTQYPHPLWVGIQTYERMSPVTLARALTGKYAADAGLIENQLDGGVTPHWFRHFFTTQLHAGYGDHDDHLEPSMIKYLRGDVYSTESGRGNDIMDIYLHDWGDTIRQEYENTIYQFGIYD